MTYKAVLPDDVTDLSLVPGELRAFRSEVRDALDGIVRALQVLSRIEERLEVVIDRQNISEQRAAKTDVRIEILEAGFRSVKADVEKLKRAAARRRK